MKFLLMIVTNEPAEAALPVSELNGIVAQYGTVSTRLRSEAKLVNAGRLRFSNEAVTIRVLDGRHVVLDGPFAESKEQIGGFYLIEVASKEEAIAWAKQLPLREAGAIEIRPARTGAAWRSAPVHAVQEFAVMFIGNLVEPPSREEVFRAIDAHYEVSLDLAAQGKFVSSRSLEPSPAAVTIRVAGGKQVVRDGPFAETKEFVAGYFIIACESKAEAIEWAKQLMAGSVACEVRPLWGAA